MTPPAPDLQEAISAVLRGWFARRRLTHGGAAQPAGMTPNTLSRKLNGKGAFTLPELEAITGYLGITVEELLADARREQA